MRMLGRWRTFLPPSIPALRTCVVEKQAAVRLNAKAGAVLSRRRRLVCDDEITLRPIDQAHDLPTVASVDRVDELTGRFELELDTLTDVELTLGPSQMPAT